MLLKGHLEINVTPNITRSSDSSSTVPVIVNGVDVLCVTSDVLCVTWVRQGNHVLHHRLYSNWLDVSGKLSY